MPCRHRDDIFDSEGNLLPGINIVGGPYSTAQGCRDDECDECSTKSCSEGTICCGDGSSNLPICMFAGDCSKQIVRMPDGRWLVRPDDYYVSGSDPGSVGQSVCGSNYINVVYAGLLAGNPAYNITSCV